jgi:hypothetical protein
MLDFAEAIHAGHGTIAPSRSGSNYTAGSWGACSTTSVLQTSTPHTARRSRRRQRIAGGPIYQKRSKRCGMRAWTGKAVRSLCALTKKPSRSRCRNFWSATLRPHRCANGLLHRFAVIAAWHRGYWPKTRHFLENFICCTSITGKNQHSRRDVYEFFKAERGNEINGTRSARHSTG